MVSPEQNIIALVNDFVHKFSIPGQVVLNPFARTFSTAKYFLLVEKHGSFSESDKGLRCFEKSVPRLVEAYAFQLLNQASYLTGDQELAEAARVYLGKGNDRKLKDALDSWLLYLDCHLSRCSKLMKCPTIAIYTKATRCITWLSTCHT